MWHLIQRLCWHTALRYAVSERQHLCQHHLLTNMTANNLLHVLFSLAHLYGSAEFRKSALTFIANSAAVQLKSGTLLPSLSPELCQEVLCAVVSVELSAALPEDYVDCFLLRLAKATTNNASTCVTVYAVDVLSLNKSVRMVLRYILVQYEYFEVAQVCKRNTAFTP
jgi:hypothetical protein